MSFLADNIGNISSAKKIGDILTAEGRKISSPTVENYTSALCDSFICYQAARYDLKEKDFLRTGRKYYLADMGMRNKIIGTRTGDLGHILENVVFLELLRRGGEVYVGKLDKEEIDFVVVRHGKKEYYQVALTVRDSATLERELRPLRKITDAYPRYLLTLDPDPEIDHAGIRQIYALSWLSE